MKNPKFISIKLHSTIDLITNSSTEIFICNTKKDIEVIKSILDTKIAGTYKEPIKFDFKEYCKWKTKDANTKVEARDWDHQYQNIDGWFYSEECKEDLEHLRKAYIQEGDKRGAILGYRENTGPFQTRIDRDILKYKETDKWKGRTEVVNKIYDEFKELSKDELPGWWFHPAQYYRYSCGDSKDLDGCIIIAGINDNSIPYDDWDWINSTFNAQNYHLG